MKHPHTDPRGCDAMGVCQARQPRCPGCTPAAQRQAVSHDTEHLPPGGMWFAPGAIEHTAKPLSRGQRAAAYVAGAFAACLFFGSAAGYVAQKLGWV